MPAPAGSLLAAEFAPKAKIGGTVLFLVGALITAMTLKGGQPSEIAHYAAVGIGLSLLASILVDLRAGFLNLIRADLMAILALYFLTLFEFLFKQEDFDMEAGADFTRKAIMACIIGFCGLVIGRHLLNARKHPLSQLFFSPLPGGFLIFAFWSFIFIGSLHMLIAVDFNPLMVFHYMIGPRFTQPWGRDRFGDWKALLVELSLFFYLIPPIAGIIIARRKKFTRLHVYSAVTGLVMVLFYAFCGGTRNVFLSYLVTFLIGYAFALPPSRKKELVFLSGFCAALMLAATVLMLQFRDIGLKNYVQGGYRAYLVHADEESLFIDYNLYSISRLVEVFPNQHRYLGFEVPYLALIRPIPRALWSGKPEGMSISMEDSMGVDGMTVAASFVGEAYMSGGLIAVFLAGLFFGAVTGWWGHLASPRNSEMGILIYSSGFFAAVISMRSLFVFTTALLPTIASIVAGMFVVKKILPALKQFLPASRRLPRPNRRPLPRGTQQ